MAYEQADEQPPKAHSRKDRKRWCRGKFGVEHRPKWEVWRTFRTKTFYKLVCTGCGKCLKFTDRADIVEATQWKRSWYEED